MTGSKTEKSFPAWFNTATGTIIPWDASNERLRLNNNMKRITAIIDPDTKQAVDINAKDTTSTVAASGDLTRMMDMLRTVTAQRFTIMAAALKLPNGEEVLTRSGLYDPEVDDTAIARADDDEIARITDPRGSDAELDKMKAKSAEAVSKKKVSAKKQTVNDFDDV